MGCRPSTAGAPALDASLLSRAVGSGIIVTMFLTIFGGIVTVIGGRGIVTLVSGGLNTPLLGNAGNLSAVIVAGLVVSGFQSTVRGFCFGLFFHWKITLSRRFLIA